MAVNGVTVSDRPSAARLMLRTTPMTEWPPAMTTAPDMPPQGVVVPASVIGPFGMAFAGLRFPTRVKNPNWSPWPGTGSRPSPVGIVPSTWPDRRLSPSRFQRGNPIAAQLRIWPSVSRFTRAHLSGLTPAIASFRRKTARSTVAEPDRSTCETSCERPWISTRWPTPSATWSAVSIARSLIRRPDPTHRVPSGAVNRINAMRLVSTASIASCLRRLA